MQRLLTHRHRHGIVQFSLVWTLIHIAAFKFSPSTWCRHMNSLGKITFFFFTSFNLGLSKLSNGSLDFVFSRASQCPICLHFYANIFNFDSLFPCVYLVQRQKKNSGTKLNYSALASWLKIHIKVSFHVKGFCQPWSMSAADRRPIDSFVFCVMCRKSVSLDASNNGEVNAEAAAVHRQISVSRGGSHSRWKTTQLYGWWKPIHGSIAQPFAMMTDVGGKKMAIILRRTQMTCTFPWKSSQWFSAADLQGFHLSRVNYAEHESHICNRNALKTPWPWHERPKTLSLFVQFSSNRNLLFGGGFAQYFFCPLEGSIWKRISHWRIALVLYFNRGINFIHCDHLEQLKVCH